MNKQYMKGVKTEKAFLTRIVNIVMAMCLFYSLSGSETRSLLFKEQSQREFVNGFQKCHVILYIMTTDILMDMVIL